MPPVRNLPPGYTVVFPNREKASSHITRLIVALILLVSIVLILAVTIGGWSKLQGLKPLNIVWCISYLLMAIWIMRWARGLLPIAAAMAMLMLLVSVIAAAGLAGASWSDRSNIGYGVAQGLFGGKGLSADTLQFLTTLIAPVQLLLIIACMVGFSQEWNVEVEAPIDRSKRRGKDGSAPANASPAAA